MVTGELRSTAHLKGGFPWEVFFVINLVSSYTNISHIFSGKTPFLMFVLSLSLVAKAPQPGPSVFISTPSFERLVAELSKGGEINIPGLQKTRRSTYELLCVLFCHAAVDINLFSFFAVLVTFLVIFLFKQHVARLKDGNIPLRLCADLRSVSAYLTPLFPISALSLVKVDHI